MPTLVVEDFFSSVMARGPVVIVPRCAQRARVEVEHFKDVAVQSSLKATNRFICETVGPTQVEDCKGASSGLP
jgi:hypothetical protein